MENKVSAIVNDLYSLRLSQRIPNKCDNMGGNTKKKKTPHTHKPISLCNHRFTIYLLVYFVCVWLLFNSTHSHFTLTHQKPKERSSRIFHCISVGESERERKGTVYGVGNFQLISSYSLSSALFKQAEKDEEKKNFF